MDKIHTGFVMKLPLSLINSDSNLTIIQTKQRGIGRQHDLIIVFVDRELKEVISTSSLIFWYLCHESL